MYPEVVPINTTLELVQNSGIQFVDYDLLVNWKTKDKQSLIRTLENGYFVKAAAGRDEPLVRLVPHTGEDGELSFVEPINKRFFEPTDADFSVSLRESLKLYDGVWFPIPYLPRESSSGKCYGPINWVRARIVEVTDPEALKEAKIRSTDESLKAEPDSHLTYYRIVLAFDTATQQLDNSRPEIAYFSPTTADVASGTEFSLAYTADRCQFFLKPMGNISAWVSEWAEAIFRDLYRERIRSRVSEEDMDAMIQEEHCHQSHYLNILAFLGIMIKPGKVHFIGSGSGIVGSTQDAVDVSLILDIGNSRSCGIMVEDHPNITREDDNFSDTYVLKLRDLNSPEVVYDKPFVSSVEFARPNFDYNNLSARSHRGDAFVWPSLVRVGTEAANLAAHREGTEGISGLTSPKRYLWNTDPLANGQWQFNNYSYQIKSKTLDEKRHELSHASESDNRAFLSSVCQYCNSTGNAYFALHEDDTDLTCLVSSFSYRSTMTFMVMEILLHAMSQMNSVAQRSRCTSCNVPRRLKAVILTTPPAMAAEEKELYRSCVYEAIGILWKSLGFDDKFNHKDTFDFATDGEHAKEINPPVPEVYMDWNEAEAGQVVYVYNESQKICRGNGETFLRQLRRDMLWATRIGERPKDVEGHPLLSGRIASIDIGGGTTDLVIKDYTLRADVQDFAADIIPHEVLKDGARIAGDDIVHDIIRSEIIAALAKVLREHKIPPKPVLQELVGESSSGIIKEMLQSQFTQQILVKIAYRVLFHLEHLDPYSLDGVVSGTVRDFLESKEVNPALPKYVERAPAFDEPLPQVVKFVNDTLGRQLPGFSIMDFPLNIDICRISQDIINARRFDICRILSKLSEVIASCKCDVLLLTGRASRLPCIHSFFLQRMNLPSSRIIPMANYCCSSWYPFSPDGEHIGDPKTTAAVGALISYLRLSHDKFPNFRFNSYPESACSNAHYVGILDNTNKIIEDNVLYKYEPQKRRAIMGEDDDDESSFIPYNREDDAFCTQLSVELGYRLLDDPNFEATPLYKIESLHSVDEVQRVRKANNLTYNDTSRESMELFISQLSTELQTDAQNRIYPLLDAVDALDQQLQEYKQGLITTVQATAKTLAEQQFPDATGFFGRAARQAAVEEQRDAFVASYVQEHYDADVEQPFFQHQSDVQFEAESQLATALGDLIEENKTLVYDKAKKKFERLQTLLNVKRDQFQVILRLSNKHSPFPVPFIRRNLPLLPVVETFELDKVYASDGQEYSQFFRMYLKTISGARVRYFMDSGNIDLSGI